MKEVLKKVYYCDFCNKRGMSKPMMARHEKVCTLNPNRECRMCDENFSSKLVEKFRKQLEIKVTKNKDKVFLGEMEVVEVISHPKIEDISDAVDGCPACTLAILRQADLNCYYLEKEIPFDYKQAKKEWWQQINSQQYNPEDYY